MGALLLLFIGYVQSTRTLLTLCSCDMPATIGIIALYKTKVD